MPHKLEFRCRCGSEWNGQNTSHCAAECHRTFSSVTAFDKHRKEGMCLYPVKVGLRLIERAGYAVWAYPTDEGSVARFDALRRSNRLEG